MSTKNTKKTKNIADNQMSIEDSARASARSNVATGTKRSNAKSTKKSTSAKRNAPKASEPRQEVKQPVPAAQPNKEDRVEQPVYKAPRIIEKAPAKDDKKRDKEKKKKVKRMPIEKVDRINASVKEGLTSEQVARRVAQGYGNVEDNKNAKTYTQIFLGNIFTFFNLLCIAVAVALICVKAPISNFIFLLTFTANLLIGIIQEIKAKKTIEKISLVVSPSATVVRDKAVIEVAVKDLVLDDIVLLNTGKQICADCIVVEGEVEVNESLLTGESVAIKKRKGDMLLSGSFVVGGKCYGRVEKVGNDSYTAKLASKAKKYQKAKSELLNSLNTIIKCIGVIIVPLAVLTFLNIYNNNADIVLAVRKTAGSTIGMIPAGMFLLTSMALAVGVIKLANKRTLVQDLYSIEMLARADVLCLDKTGTITDGTMKVHSVVQIKADNHPLNEVMGSMLTALDDNNQTSRALSTHFGFSKEFTAKQILPFTSARKLSGVTFKNGETYAYGAPEFVFRGMKNPEIDKQVKQYAQKGFRVLMLVKCHGEIKDDKLPEKKECLCLIVIEDHIREDAPRTIQWFKENGVQIKIISGDNPLTVSEVSKRVGVDRADKYISLEGLTEQQVVDAAEKYTVFGRVTPEQKCILVKALKQRGHKVAMTGDGVNDILALKEADCSIAMASGSEATRNVSHLVLMDSNFGSMPAVVAEGRRVVNNIQNSSSLYLMKTIFTMLLTIFYLCIPDSAYPFDTSHIMLLEFFVIGVPSFFLALQPNNQVIQGKFLPNLLSKSIPSALIFTINAIACYIFDVIVGTGGQFVTMSALAVSFAGILVLFKLCKPFNIYRGVLFTATTLLMIVALCIVPWSFFGYMSLSLQNTLFVVILVQLSYPIYNTIIDVFNRIRFRPRVR